MPPFAAQQSQFGVPSIPSSMPVVNRLMSDRQPIFNYQYYIIGQTLDASGQPLANCSLVVFRTADNSVEALLMSDANGNYIVITSPAVQHYINAYLPGSPDVAGTTVDTLVGS